MSTFQSVGDDSETARYRMMQELKRAVRAVRDAEDIARLELKDETLATRIRELHEHCTEDIFHGKNTHSKWARLPL